MDKTIIESKDKVSIIPLGGVEEIGINCTVLQCKNKIIVIDAGLGFAGAGQLGIDYLIPNYEYLVENKEKIEGIFITHGHLDHIGALSIFLEKLDYPDLFAPRFAMELIKAKLEENHKLDKAKLHIIEPHSVLKSDPLKVEFFRVNHSIPDSYGVIIHTPAGVIVHSGDFKFDNSPLNEPHADYAKMADFGEKGVRLLLSDSTNSFKPGHSISELDIMKKLEEVIRQADGRVIVATFASLVTRLYALVEIAKKTERKILIAGRSMQMTIDIARKLHYVTAHDDLFVDNRHVNRYSDNKIMVLATGSQGEEMAALSRMARGEHRDVKLKRGDTVVLSSSIIPGNDALVQKLIDDISRFHVKVYHQDIMNLHTSGHGFMEDQKLMINLIQPQLFMPVHGYQYFLRKHGETAQEVGIQERNVIIAKRGEIIEISKDEWERNGVVKSKPIPVSGLGVGDVGPIVLDDREKLANNGVVVVSLLIKKTGQNFKLHHNPHVVSRGFVFVKENEELMEGITNKVKEVFTTQKISSTEDRIKLRSAIQKSLESYLYTYTERRPLILANIDFID